MLWLKSMILTMQMAGLVGLWGISSDVEEIIDNFNLAEIYEADVVYDFLSMDAETFEKQYDKNALYERDILYCTREAWKYDGEQLDGFQDPEDYYEVENITAIRFINLCSTDTNMYVESDVLEDVQDRVFHKYFEDYAVSMFFQERKDVQGEVKLRLMEFSFVKVKLEENDRRETAPETLYDFLERNYYEAREEIETGEWAVSPEKDKAVCISNGALPKHPSQIFVRLEENVPDLVFRWTWECYFTGWIDKDHFIFYNDFGLYMVHIETSEIEEIITVGQEEDFETWGCKYEIKGDRVIATCGAKNVFYWDIVSGNGEVRLLGVKSGEGEENRVMNEQLERIANPYFPAKEHMTLKVRANYYMAQEPIDEIVDAEIDRLRVYEKGCIYKLKIYVTTHTASFDFPVMVRYFYVKADEINLIWPFYQAEPNGKCIYFYDDDELLLQTFDTEEKLESKGSLEPVCREENIEEEEASWFCSMKKEKDRVTFYRREKNHSGDEMQKDLFVWEKGKGLVQFETGFGPGPMEVTITEICEVHNR